MKKVLFMLLALTVMVSMSGCSGVGDGNDQVLSVALSPDYAPYEFIVDSNLTTIDKYAGADVSLAKYIAQKLGMTLEITEASFDTCPTLVNANKVDISISGFSWTPGRANNFLLSESYFNEGDGLQQVLINASDVDKYKSLADLNNSDVIVGAQSGSLQDELVDEFLPNATKQQITELDLGVTLLAQGRIDALAISEYSADVRLDTVSGIALLPENFDTPELGLVVLGKKGNEELFEKINAIIKEVVDQNLYATWIAEASELAKSMGIEE